MIPLMKMLLLLQLRHEGKLIGLAFTQSLMKQLAFLSISVCSQHPRFISSCTYPNHGVVSCVNINFDRVVYGIIGLDEGRGQGQT